MLQGVIQTVGRMALRCPPEVLLRNAIRSQQETGVGVSARCVSSSADVPTYRAAVCTDLGQPLGLRQLPRPPLGHGEVRVAVQSAGINFADILLIQGKYQEKPELPFVPGSELAGEVLEVGKGVENVQPGDRVLGVSPTFGAFAEEAVVQSRVLAPLPDSLSYATGAALVITYATAYMALTRRANIKEGDTVLVTAAAGGVGLAAVDLAANVFNAKVIGACGSPAKCALVKGKGAFATIDYSQESLRERIKELTNGRGADIVMDAVGGTVFDQCLRCIAFEGRLVVIGFASGEIPKVPANILLVKSCSVVGIYWGSYSVRCPPAFAESVRAVLQYAADDKIKPHVSHEFGMHQVNNAIKMVAERQSTGKVIVDVRYSFEH